MQILATRTLILSLAFFHFFCYATNIIYERSSTVEALTVLTVSSSEYFMYEAGRRGGKFIERISRSRQAYSVALNSLAFVPGRLQRHVYAARKINFINRSALTRSLDYYIVASITIIESLVERRLARKLIFACAKRRKVS